MKTNMTMTIHRLKLICLTVVSLWSANSASGQEPINDPGKVDLPFNRFYDFDEIEDALQRITAAYPDLCTLESIGKSSEGRDLWMMTLNNAATGSDRDKPAMYIDGNVHGNEVQAAETCLYSIWYLTKSYGRVEWLTRLMDERSFYILCSVNPDGRAHWFNEPNTSSSSRSGKAPTDNDYDGLKDEDGYDDLDGDGYITTMWRKDPRGSHRFSQDEPRTLERVPAGKFGDYSFAGSEGIDNDNDGRINEDGPGGYDMNRNWPSDWQPNHIQFGAGHYPFSYPETRAIGDFILDHPNIASVQSYHNAGGMLLRGPGAQYRENYYPRSDVAVYDELGRTGEKIIPFYRYLIIWKDLYGVHGGFVNWTYEGLGIFSFTNELWSSAQAYYGKEGDWGRTEARRKFDDHLMFGEFYRPYKKYDHPTLGEVLIGGTSQYGSRVPPPFMMEELCHRNFAFTMYNADQMPRPRFGRIGVRPLDDNGLWEVSAEIRNTRIIPTTSGVAFAMKIGSRDFAELRLEEGNGAVVTSGTLGSWFDKQLSPTEHHTAKIWLDRGISGRGQVYVRWLVKGRGQATLRFESQKGGTISTPVELKEQDVDLFVED